MSGPIYLGPFARITNVHWNNNDEQWVIIQGAHGIPDVNYAGESDFINSKSSARESTGHTLTAGPFFHHEDALAAWVPYDGTVDPGTNWHQLLHWTKTTDVPTPPIDYLDDAWVVEQTMDGYCGYGAYFGRKAPPGNLTPDPNCPPEVYVSAAVAWASSDAALAFLAWQQSLTTVHNSFTVSFVPYGGTESLLSCTPGAP